MNERVQIRLIGDGRNAWREVSDEDCPDLESLVDEPHRTWLQLAGNTSCRVSAILEARTIPPEEEQPPESDHDRARATEEMRQRHREQDELDDEEEFA